jgi:hypothetical protein
MMLAGLPVAIDAVDELAKTVRSVGADVLADRLERALDNEVKRRIFGWATEPETSGDG